MKEGGGGADNNGNNSTEATPLLLKANIRSAFDQNDAEASRLYHKTKTTAAAAAASEDGHQTEGGSLLKPIIFGGLDGILTSFAIVAGAAGGRLPPSVVLILGFSNIFADAVAMGVGEFLSSKAENEWILSEREREEWELENYRDGEIAEMIEIYEQKGLSHDDAAAVINTMAKYKDFFVDLMMAQELELKVPDANHVKESMQEGVVMFCSFAFFGALPLLGYVVVPAAFPRASEEVLFGTACVVTGLVLFFMGCVKSWFSPHHWTVTGLETLLLGGACASVAYGIGQFVKTIVGDGAASSL
jgi:VIT1/CCC1 family predicted Fe2+/Mn2+ transporter